jgi:hypothetical protein
LGNPDAGLFFCAPTIQSLERSSSSHGMETLVSFSYQLWTSSWSLQVLM